MIDYLEIIRIITPWLSGSVAGVLLTLIVNSRVRRRSRKILSIEEKVHEYSLNFGSSHKLDVDKKIKVTYNSKEYHNLLLYSVILKMMVIKQ